MLKYAISRSLLGTAICASLVVGVPGLPLRATGRQTPATFSGSLIDPTGRALPDVTLTFVHQGTDQKYETRTDQAGRFSIVILPGDYEVHISKPGFAAVAARVVLEAGQQLERDVVPQVAGIMHTYRVLTKADPAKSRRTVVRTTADDPCKGSSVAGCITPPMRMVEAWPLYPPAHAAKGESASVEVRGRLGTDGFLKDLRPNDGADVAFAAAAIDALRQWEYAPVRVNGVPQECPVTVTFRFDAGTD